MLNHGTYNIIDGDYKTAKEKESLWEISIGLNEVDGLKPSEYLIRLTKESIEGGKSYKEIEEELNNHYNWNAFRLRPVSGTLFEIVFAILVSVLGYMFLTMVSAAILVVKYRKDYGIDFMGRQKK